MDQHQHLVTQATRRPTSASWTCRATCVAGVPSSVHRTILRQQLFNLSYPFPSSREGRDPLTHPVLITVVRTPLAVSSTVIARARLSIPAAQAEKTVVPGRGAYPAQEERWMIRFWPGVEVRWGRNVRAIVKCVRRFVDIVSYHNGVRASGETAQGDVR